MWNIVRNWFFPATRDKRLQRLASIIGYWPGRNAQLFKTALRHSSVIYTQKIDLPSNERLEFLGDAVLELVISEILYERFPDKHEGELTKLRIKMVNRQFLNGRAIDMGLPSLLHQFVGKKKHLLKEQHSIFGNALEALIGAVYLDKGFKQARRFVEEQILVNEERFNQALLKKVDFKSQLMSWSQRRNITIAFTDLASHNHEQFAVCVTLDSKRYGNGIGKRKKQAHQDAARNTIQLLKEQGEWQ